MTTFGPTEDQARPDFVTEVETEVFGRPWTMNSQCDCPTCKDIKVNVYEAQVPVEKRNSTI